AIFREPLMDVPFGGEVGIEMRTAPGAMAAEQGEFQWHGASRLSFWRVFPATRHPTRCLSRSGPSRSGFQIVPHFAAARAFRRGLPDRLPIPCRANRCVVCAQL